MTGRDADGDGRAGVGEARAAVLALLTARAPGATVCPSEAARALAGPGGDWRAQMPAVHAAVAAMTTAGEVRLSWRGQPRAVGEGPYRIGGPVAPNAGG